MIKELKEEIKFCIENPLLALFVVGFFTGIIPSLFCALLEKIF